MSETKHTPGPWKHGIGHHQSYDHFGAVVSIGDGLTYKTLARLPELGDESTNEELEANARLIAAAPDLLRAAELQEQAEDHWANCEECEYTESPELGCETAVKLADDARYLRRAAIAKSKGIDYHVCPECGVNFAEFPEQSHAPEECGGLDCTCYEIHGGAHQMGCPMYR